LGLRIGVYYAQITTKSEASRKSRADLEETVFRIIYFIFAYAETIIKCFSKGVIYRPVLHLYAIAYLFSVRYCEIVLADRLTTLQKVPMICFCFNIAKQPLR